MAKINDIQDKLVEILSTASGLTSIKKWNKVNGILLAVHPAGCVGVEREVFKEYTHSSDEAVGTIKIYLYLQHVKPEDGERQVRELAHEARYALSADRTLGGLITAGYISAMDYVTVDASETLLLHAAELTYTAEYLQNRTK